MTETEPIVEDATGLLCPLPVIKLAERIAEIPSGGTVLLLADDPAAEEDVRLWCVGHGHSLECVERAGSVTRMWVKRS